jgi:hypothetical protein
MIKVISYEYPTCHFRITSTEEPIILADLNRVNIPDFFFDLVNQ